MLQTTSDFQEEGEVCESCRLFWEHQGMPPMTLHALRDEDDNPITTDGGIPIVVCPRCDGEAILKLKKG